MGLLGLGKPNFMKSAVERYKDHLESLMESKASVFRNKSASKKLSTVYTLHFTGIPNSGLITVFSYGVSYRANRSAVELMLSVKSEDLNWVHALGFIGNHLREDCPFDIGQTIQFGQPITNESKISNFLIGEPSLLASATIPIDRNTTANLVQLYPVHEAEINTIRRVGWQRFLQDAGHNIYDTKRSPIY